MTDRAEMVCEEPGCNRGPATGDALYRTNPRGPGQGFKGRCGMHMGEPVDPLVADIVGDIEEDNRRKKRNLS